MSATFDNTLSRTLDQMRAALGDRDVPDNALRQDEEYAAQLAISGDAALATAVMAEGLAAEYARRVDSFSESGGISVRWGERVKTWLALAKSIRDGSVTRQASGGVSAVAVRVGGIVTSEYVRECGGTWFSETTR
jgi:hypothetical protein